MFDDGMGDMADVRAPADRAGCDRPTTTGSAPSAAADSCRVAEPGTGFSTTSTVWNFCRHGSSMSPCA
ncbi:hypothetical protein [Streptomyces sp. V1I1]|uniref:hypothetical protein n=1 Tax=Streptomyces sp. V1I1 TaxID=3042272 RepID=UPI0027834EC7|nr:hypothetical protein [Streptomyces sp. V1I1]MDQ0939000.1 hypothetical protein [Streptomyces sp. V1I1]